MIIDCILDRRDGIPYSPDDFYRNVFAYGVIGSGKHISVVVGL